MCASRVTHAPPMSTPTGSMEAPYLLSHPLLHESKSVLNSSSLVVVRALIARIGSSRHWEYNRVPCTREYSVSEGSNSWAGAQVVREHPQRTSAKLNDQGLPAASNRAEGSKGSTRRAFKVALFECLSVPGRMCTVYLFHLHGKPGGFEFAE